MHQPNQPNYIWSTFADCEKQNNSYRYKLPCACIVCQNCLTQQTLRSPYSRNYYGTEISTCPVCLQPVVFAPLSYIEDENIDSNLLVSAIQVRFQSAIVQNDMMVDNWDAANLLGKLFDLYTEQFVGEEEMGGMCTDCVAERYTEGCFCPEEMGGVSIEYVADCDAEQTCGLQKWMDGLPTYCWQYNLWDVEADVDKGNEGLVNNPFFTALWRHFLSSSKPEIDEGYLPTWVVTPMQLEQDLQAIIDLTLLGLVYQFYSAPLVQHPDFQTTVSQGNWEAQLEIAKENVAAVKQLIETWSDIAGQLVGLLALRHIMRFRVECVKEEDSTDRESDDENNEDEDEEMLDVLPQPLLSRRVPSSLSSTPSSSVNIPLSDSYTPLYQQLSNLVSPKVLTSLTVGRKIRFAEN